ncbi:hypothetical protein CQA62_03910 [Helicobacter cholecystus]|uniref:Campylobacter invasion antigen D C-terminal domain-containing protein n=1 Tax=Helicobacter cholecystus TaxID=45498 RepID=A0A3D8IW90_9HELI|nr:hypothetical protein [Helicobacter cholecystus]RDU69293.1 hypothetical protein CQA62_03910 [Helicobacter cholecystus]VEJ24371.1 Uncharacterised protein [Helicobacter cholecystus]
MKQIDVREVILETLSQIDGKKDRPTPEEMLSADREILSASLIDEKEFLSNQRKKLLVLFEGLLSPETKEIEQKLELVLKYLQYSLSEIDKRLGEI